MWLPEFRFRFWSLVTRLSRIARWQIIFASWSNLHWKILTRGLYSDKQKFSWENCTLKGSCKYELLATSGNLYCVPYNISGESKFLGLHSFCQKEVGVSFDWNLCCHLHFVLCWKLDLCFIYNSGADLFKTLYRCRFLCK